jgi:hypothetical protein
MTQYDIDAYFMTITQCTLGAVDRLQMFHVLLDK